MLFPNILEVPSGKQPKSFLDYNILFARNYRNHQGHSSEKSCDPKITSFNGAQWKAGEGGTWNFFGGSEENF
jgi:hypothetical protein